MRYQTLLFDADGTLLDFDKSEEMALIHTFQKYEIQFNENVKQAYEKINSDLWTRFEHGEIDKHTVLYTRFVKLFEVFNIDANGVRFEDDYQTALGEGAYILADALDILVELQNDFNLYIVTNGVSRTQYARLDETGIRALVKEVFVSEDIGFQKPQIEYLDYVSSHIPNFQKDKALIIGDSLTSDIKGGMIAGIDTCWFNMNQKVAPSEYDITYEIHKLKDIIKIVKGC